MSDYQREFREISMQLMDRLDASDWTSIFQRLVHWKLELEQSEDAGMSDILDMQFKDANRQFAKFYESNYAEWMAGPGEETPFFRTGCCPPSCHGCGPRRATTDPSTWS